MEDLSKLGTLGVYSCRYVSWVGKREIINFTALDEVHTKNGKIQGRLFFQPARRDFPCASSTHLQDSTAWLNSTFWICPDSFIREIVFSQHWLWFDLFLLWTDYYLLSLLETHDSPSIPSFSAILQRCTQEVVHWRTMIIRERKIKSS